MKKVFITGATGLVGSYMADKLITEGLEVYALYRENSSQEIRQTLSSKINWVEGDILDVNSLSENIQGKDWVVHSAALVSLIPKEKKIMQKINVEGTANIVNVCLEHQVERLGFVSSIGSLGKPKNKTTLDEETKWEESSQASAYAETKYLAEMEVFRGIAEGLSAVIVNPSTVFGVGDWTKSSLQLFKFAADGAKFYTGGMLNYVDARDVADTFFELLKSDSSGERFILSGGQVSFKEVFEKIAKRFQVKAPSQKVSYIWLEILWRISHIQSLLTGTKPLITKEVAQTARLSYFYPNDKVKKTLNFEFRDLEESLDWACKGLAKKYGLRV